MSKAKKYPVALAGADWVAMRKIHLIVISQNPTSCQRWKARLPMRRITVSPELRAYLSAMKGACK